MTDDKNNKNLEEPSVPTPGEAAPKKAEKDKPGLMQRSFRWLLAILVLIGLGSVLVIYLLYVPMQDRAIRAEIDLNNANQTINDLKVKLETLSSLEPQNKGLQQDLGQQQLHIVILTARGDVLTAQLALAKQEPAKAKLALAKTPEALKKMGELLPADQKKNADDLQARLKQAVGELDGKASVAQLDLEALAVSLLEMESALYSRP